MKVENLGNIDRSLTFSQLMCWFYLSERVYNRVTGFGGYANGDYEVLMVWILQWKFHFTRWVWSSLHFFWGFAFVVLVDAIQRFGIVTIVEKNYPKALVILWRSEEWYSNSPIVSTRFRFFLPKTPLFSWKIRQNMLLVIWKTCILAHEHTVGHCY